MENPLPVDKLDRLLPALRPLAEPIGDGIIPIRDDMRNILNSIGLEKEDWALKELILWCEILKKAKNISDIVPKEEVIKELRERLIPEFQAVLAVNIAQGKPPTAEPTYIDFGILCQEEELNSTLRISHVYVKEIIVENDPKTRLTLTTKKIKSDEALINVFISVGKLEEQLQASIVVKGMRDDLVIPVTAKWGRVKPCPCCNLKSLFWNFNDRQYECLNGKCNARGPTLDNLKGPLCDK